jgi:hypothetical protein
VLLCIYRVLLKGKKNVHSSNELKQQGATWVRKQGSWLFGTATFKDGNQITDRQVVADAQHFFNTLDRHVLTRKQTLQGTRLERLVFLEYGKLGTNAHIHFFIKGTDLKHFKQIYYAATRIWQSRINQAHNLIIKDNIGSDNTRSEYCWKEVKSHQRDVLLTE